jgi:hypothetical protein
MDCHRATCDGREWLREDGESFEVFKKRVHNSLPVGGLPKMVVFFPG